MVTATARVRAPELVGSGGWINTVEPLTLERLRGRAILLDFWTFCCINCIHVIEEVRPLEQRFGDRLVVMGVHSPKFPHEADHEAVRQAVRRHRITHPVLDDPELRTWERYGVRAWPTLVVIDPDGYVIAQAAGEGNAARLADTIDGALKGRHVPSEPSFAPAVAADQRALSFPGKVASDGAHRLAVADTGHDRVLVCDLEGRVVQTFGGFHQPQGVRFDGDRLLVCDTVGGELTAVALDGSGRKTLAGGLSSPWDVVVLPDGDIAVAEAGLHRIARVPHGGGLVTILAGTRAEGLRDGPAELAHLAQPSGLAVLPDGAIAVADSEVSALRVIRNGRVDTLVGEGLFDWGDADGDSEHARLQHPLGVAALGGGRIAVADTFNSKLRVWHDGRLETLELHGDLDEPGGLDVLPDGRLVVADTNHHRVVIVDAASGELLEVNLTPSLGDRAAELGPALTGGRATSVQLHLPDIDLDGEALDHSQGPPVRVTVSADPPGLLGAGPRAWALDDVVSTVSLTLGVPGSGILTVDLVAATCSGDVCTVHRNSEQRPLIVQSD